MKRGWLSKLLEANLVAATFVAVFFLCVAVVGGGLRASFKGARGPCAGKLTRESTVGEWCAQIDSAGSLIDRSGENLLLQSEDFSTTWLLVNVSVVVNTIKAPDNSLTADTIHESYSKADGPHHVDQSFALTAGHTYTYSVWALQDNRTWVSFWEDLDGLDGYFDLATCVTGTTTASSTKASAAVGDWCRVSMTWTSTGGASNLAIAVAEADNDRSFPGEDWDSLYAWGAQLVDNTDGVIVGPGVYHPTGAANKSRLDLADAGAPGLGVSSVQGLDGNRIPARTFDGAADYYSKAHHASMNIHDSDFTLTMLLMRDATDDGEAIAYCHGNTDNDGFYLQASVPLGQWIAQFNKSGSHAGPSVTVSTTDDRYHVVQVIRGDDVATIYVDGTASTPVSVAGYGIDANRSLYLGAYDGGALHWDGGIVYARLDAEALSIDDLVRDRESLWAVAGSLTAVPREDVIVDGDMEDTGDPTLIWTPGNSAVLTKETDSPWEGMQVLRVAHDGLDHPYAYQVILTVGTHDRITGRARGDGTAHPRLVIGGVYVWIGATSTDWQAFDIVVLAQNTSLVLMGRTTAASYVEFDDVYVIEHEDHIADFSRTTTAYATFSDMSMAEFPVDVSRVAGDGGGALVEGPATNKLLQSQDFSTTWTTIASTISTDVAVAPDGKTTVDGIVGSAITNDHGVCQNQTSLTAEPWTFHILARPGDQGWLYLHSTTIANATAFFDIANGHIGILGAGVDDYGIELAWGGFYHAWIVFTGTVAQHTFCVYSAEADNDSQFLGDAFTVNTYVWQAQVEQGTFPTSIIPTTTTEVTRAADSLTYDPHPPNSTEIVLPEFLAPTGNATKITLYGKWKGLWSAAADIGATRRLLNIGDSASANNDLELYVHTDGKVYLSFTDSGGTVRTINGVAHTTYDEWFTVRAVVDFADLSNSELWVNEAVDHDADSNMTGTAAWDTSGCLLRLGADRSGAVDGYNWTKDLQVTPSEVRAP